MSGAYAVEFVLPHLESPVSQSFATQFGVFVLREDDAAPCADSADLSSRFSQRHHSQVGVRLSEGRDFADAIVKRVEISAAFSRTRRATGMWVFDQREAGRARHPLGGQVLRTGANDVGRTPVSARA